MLTALVTGMGTVAVLLILWVELVSAHQNRPATTRHTLDCLDWQRSGTTDPYCTAIHDTAWFAPTTETTND